jgi:hypothetical protein
MNTEQMNAQPVVDVTDLLMKTLENAMKTMVVDSVKRLAGEYNFNADDALMSLNIDAAKVNRKAMPKRQPGAPKEAKEKKVKVFLPFSCYTMPWSGCQGLSNNHGLFTPCEGAKAEGATYCAKCQAQSEKNANGLPDCGTVEMRQTLGASFKDPKGRKPTAYTRALEAVKVTIEQAVEFANSKGIEIPAEDLIVYEKKRGRPQAAAVSATSVDGIFGEAIVDAASNSDGSTASKTKKPKMTEEEKKAASEKREQDKKQKEEVAEKLKSEATTAKALASIGYTLEKIIAEGVREEVAQKAIADHNEAIQKKAAAAEKRKADAAAKKALEQKVKAEALAKAAAEAAPVVVAAAPVVEAAPAPVVEAAPAPVVEAAPAPVVAAPKPKSVRFTYTDGNKYVRSAEGLVYNNELTKQVGTWNAETKTIEFITDDEEEVEEEEIDEESD